MTLQFIRHQKNEIGLRKCIVCTHQLIRTEMTAKATRPETDGEFG